MLDQVTLTTDIRSEISFFKEEELLCLVCKTFIPQETIITGRGRLDAGDLTDDLHRLFTSSEEHGELFPIIYLVYTCPNCYFSVMKKDFKKLHRNSIVNFSTPLAKLRRQEMLLNLFSTIPDFTQRRDLISGLATYMLAIETYNQFDSLDSPTIRMGICALRCAWICQHIKEHGYEDESIDFIIKIFYKKAMFLYDQAIELSMTGSEDLGAIGSCGPDFDKDYGYDGVVYVSTWLNVHYGDKTDSLERERTLKKSKTNISKVFGFGISSKEKPSVLLGVARDIYDLIETELKILL